MAASTRERRSGGRDGGRRRRSADEARRAILDVAQARLVADGPASLRLQEIAAEVGVSHPTILHHFGSREGLVRAVIQRALRELDLDLIRALSTPEVEDIDVPALLERAFDTLGRHGQARLLAWLTLSGERDEHVGEGTGRFLDAIVDLVHARRHAAWRGEGAPSYEESQFAVMLGTLALLGDALFGDAIRARSGLGNDPDAARRFRGWLAGLLLQGLAPPSPPEAKPPARGRGRRG